MFKIHPTARIKPSPFYESTVAAGLQEASIYNSMIMPTSYGDPEAEYWRIINGVSLWDVACERQVEISGPDAAQLAQILSPRRLDICQIGQGKYVPLCNHAGTLINDPILLKLADDRFWFSIADSDIWFWAGAIAAERGLNVSICDPGVSPLAVQGPKGEDVIASLFGDWVRELKYFWFRETMLDDIPVALQRSGWSKQGGFEIYLRDSSRGKDLWDRVMEAGKPFDIGPGAPATAERYESGLVSVGGDTDSSTNPFEVRLGKYVDLDVPDDVVGIQALRKIASEGPKRHQLGVIMPGKKNVGFKFAWEPIEYKGEMAGHLTNRTFSPRLGMDIGYALIRRDIEAGEEILIHSHQGPVEGTLVPLPFL